MIICLDVDGIVNDLVYKTLKLYNSRTGKNIQMSDITTYNFLDCLPEEDAEEIIKLFKEEELWNSLKPLPGSQNGVKQLIKKGHQVYFATATDPMSFVWKIKWFEQYFPFVSSDNVIRIIDKSLLSCDVLVEDCLDNLISSFCERVCLDYPYNHNDSKDFAYSIHRAYNWNDIINIINKIEKEMREYG